MLACIDGTDSHNWRKVDQRTGRANSSVYNFFVDSADKRKRYFDGPAWAKTGLDVFDIASAVWNFLLEGLRADPSDNVSIIGHSRGGHIAAAVAAFLNRDGWLRRAPAKTAPSLWDIYSAEGGMATGILSGMAGDNGMGNAVNQMMQTRRLDQLKKQAGVGAGQEAQPVQFLGLYDAVNWAIFFDTGTITPNVRNVYHAVRDDRYHSRDFFRHTARQYDSADAIPRIRKAAQPGAYHEKIIMGSHSAIGGAPGEGDIKNITHYETFGLVGGMRPTSLQQCTTPVTTTPGRPLFVSQFAPPLQTYNYTCNIDRTQTELSATLAADRFIRAGARASGLPFH